MPYVYPNILITGTPCTGKSRLAKEIADRTGMEWFDIKTLVLKERLYKTCNEQDQNLIIDEDKVIKFLKPKMKFGECIIDSPSSNMFSGRGWFAGVFVSRTDLTILYDRLHYQGFSSANLKETVKCELFEVQLEEAYTSFDPNIVHEIYNNTEEDLAKNVGYILSILKNKPKLRTSHSRGLQTAPK